MADVVAGLLLRDGKALLGLRKPGGKRGGLWETPGGKCDETLVPGDHQMNWRTRECHETALIREWQEELGINIIVGRRVATALFDLEICFTVTLYQVTTTEEPKCLDHAELRWVDLQHAIEYMPCSPALYAHWPAVRNILLAAAVEEQVKGSQQVTVGVDMAASYTEPKTSDYCVLCGESPDSGSHLPAGHPYVDPRFNAIAARDASTPFEHATLGRTAEPYRCNVPMCGESGVCDECRKRGAR